MPQCDEREDQRVVDARHDSRHPGLGAGAAHGDVDVADVPEIEAAVPAAPEGDGGGVVGETAEHVFGRVDTVDEGPETEEAPWEQELEPEHVQVEVGEETELRRGVVVPVRICFGDCDAVVEMEHDFYGKQAE